MAAAARITAVKLYSSYIGDPVVCLRVCGDYLVAVGCISGSLTICTFLDAHAAIVSQHSPGYSGPPPQAVPQPASAGVDERKHDSTAAVGANAADQASVPPPAVPPPTASVPAPQASQPLPAPPGGDGRASQDVDASGSGGGGGSGGDGGDSGGDDSTAAAGSGVGAGAGAGAGAPLPPDVPPTTNSRARKLLGIGDGRPAVHSGVSRGGKRVDGTLKQKFVALGGVVDEAGRQIDVSAPFKTIRLTPHAEETVRGTCLGVMAL